MSEADDEREFVKLDMLTPSCFAAALHSLGAKLRVQAMEIEGVLAHFAGVAYGHPEASNEESHMLREAAAAIDVSLRRLYPEFCPKKSVLAIGRKQGAHG